MLTPAMNFPVRLEYTEESGIYPAIITGQYDGNYTAIIKEVGYTYCIIFNNEGKRIYHNGNIDYAVSLSIPESLEQRVRKLFNDMPVEEAASIRAITNVHKTKKISGIRMIRRINNLGLSEAKFLFELIAEGKL